MVRQTFATWGRLVIAATAVVCLAQAQDSTAVAARVKTAVGRVDVMRGVEPWALSSGESISPKQLVKTGVDGYAVFTLADGSEFEVFPNSEVTFRDNPGNFAHLLEVWLGRVRVHIQKLSGGKPNPNRIGTPTAVISVKGTIFHVGVEDGGATTIVMVEEGLVGVSHKILPGREIPVAEGESVTVYRNQALAKANVDKGAIANNVARAASEILGRILWNRQGSAGAGPTSIPGTSAPGNTTDQTTAPPSGGTAPPAGPPPPPGP